MFLARKDSGRPGGRAKALTGPVTVEGEALGAWLEGERRDIAVYGPAGYRWVPQRGQEVLVLKAGEDGERPCAVGVPLSGEGLKPGEVEIAAGKAAIRLSSDGSVAITGKVTVNGPVVGPLPDREEDE